MHRLAFVLLLALTVPSQAVEIHVLAPGLIGPGLLILAQRWARETGNTIAGGDGATVGKIEQAIAAGGAGDLVLLPSGEFAGMTDKLKPGSQKAVGQILFGLAVKTGAPHPDISTLEKFHAALTGKSVGYNDPANGSLAGRMVDGLLKQPSFAGVTGVPTKTLSGAAVAAGSVDMAIAVEPEEVGIKGIDIVGPVPDGAGLRLDIAGAVLANSAHPEEAASFLAYITRPEMKAVWLPTGIAP